MTTATTCPFALPLKVVNGNLPFTGVYIWQAGDEHYHANEVATFYGKNCQQEADEIVRRVNAHDDLVAALRGAKDAAQAFTNPEDEMPQDTGEFRDLKESLVRIREVLAKIEAA